MITFDTIFGNKVFVLFSDADFPNKSLKQFRKQLLIVQLIGAVFLKRIYCFIFQTVLWFSNVDLLIII